jgi:hypothetical protein
MLPRTIFLSRLIGLFTLILSLAEAMHRAAIVAIADELINVPALLLISGMCTLLAGLAMVLSHNIWTGGATPVVVTVVGWVLLVRGIVFVAISPDMAAEMLERVHFADYYYYYVTVSLCLGLFLTFTGFSTIHPGHQPSPEATFE